jgi:hypothetical protein
MDRAKDKKGFRQMRGHPQFLHCTSCGDYEQEYGPMHPWGERSRWCPSCAEEGLRNLKNKRDELEKELARLNRVIPESEAFIAETKRSAAQVKAEKEAPKKPKEMWAPLLQGDVVSKNMTVIASEELREMARTSDNLRFEELTKTLYVRVKLC